MIRKKHDIDKKLILNFISENKFDDSIEESILNWYAFLGDIDYEKSRDNAIAFLKELASDALLELNFPHKEKEKLINAFNPLESILRTAYSLNTPTDFNGKTKNKINIRDHLSHTIRDILFSNFIMSFFKYEINNNIKRQLNIASIFHDFGYPIEKLKKIGHNLQGATFSEMLNSDGDINFKLKYPDDLLEIMDFWGNLTREKKIDKNTRIKIEHIYKYIITPAIAGKGLFDSKHNLSSVILFLRPILKYWINSKTYMSMKIESICDISLAIAYHDRSLDINKLKNDNIEIPLIVKILRIADELQEWDRTRIEESYIKDVKIIPNNEISLKIILKNIDDNNKCNPNMFIRDKIIGLSPVIENNSLNLQIEFPQKINIIKNADETLNNKNNYEVFYIDKILNKYIDNDNLDNIRDTMTINLSFHNNKVKIKA